MTTNAKNWPGELGFLRSALLGLALLNMLLPMLALLITFETPAEGHNLWSILMTVIPPVMAPLFATGILFDYVMSRVRAADAEGEQRRLYATIGRIELAVIVINLLFWVTYFTFVFD